MFIGRIQENALLERYYQKKSAQLVALYGRRRVGKSSLIKHFCKGKPAFYFEGVEGQNTPEQIKHFIHSLNQQVTKQTKDPFLAQMSFASWDEVFTYLTQKVLTKNKMILVLDELQWMAARQTKLIALLKYYWDHHWKDKKIMLILCGSIASFMIDKVIRSKALYGRINLELHLTELKPFEALQFLKKRSPLEIIQYLLVFGGIPKYLEEIDTKRSFEHNINRLCFSKTGLMVSEFEKIFYGQFSEAQSYLKIMKALSQGAQNLEAISKKTKIPSGGGLSGFLHSLTQAEFVLEQVPFGKNSSSRIKKYRIIDEYIGFYFKYIQPHHKLILQESPPNFFVRHIKPQWNAWLALAFEKFCIKHAFYLAKLMDFQEEVLDFGPLFEKESPGYQIDLLYRRSDRVIVLCEVKFHESPVGTKIIPEIEKKKKLMTTPRGYTVETALISLYGASPALRDTEFFQYELTLDAILRNKIL